MNARAVSSLQLRRVLLPAGREPLQPSASRSGREASTRPATGSAGDRVRARAAFVADPSVADRRRAARCLRRGAASGRQLRGRLRQRRPRGLPGARGGRHQHPGRAHRGDRGAGAGAHPRRRSPDERCRARPARRALAAAGTRPPIAASRSRASTVGVVGMGRIGNRYARLAHGLGAEIVYAGPSREARGGEPSSAPADSGWTSCSRPPTWSASTRRRPPRPAG